MKRNIHQWIELSANSQLRNDSWNQLLTHALHLDQERLSFWIYTQFNQTLFAEQSHQSKLDRAKSVLAVNSQQRQEPHLLLARGSCVLVATDQICTCMMEGGCNYCEHSTGGRPRVSSPFTKTEVTPTAVELMIILKMKQKICFDCDWTTPLPPKAHANVS